MKKSIIICLVSTLICTGTFAQDYAFRVLINKGKNEYKSGGAWQPVKVGSSINKNDDIKVSENSYVGLVHSSGKSLEIKAPGTYNAAKLAADIGGGQSGILAKYTDFILSANDKKTGLAATGAVDRGIPGQVKVYLPAHTSTSPVYGNTVIVNWDVTETPGPYIVTCNSMFGDELKRFQVSGNSVSIDLTDPSFENEDNFLVDVTPKSDPKKKSDQHTIKKFSKADRDRFKSSLGEMKDAVAEPTAINKYFLAAFFEKNGLLVDAITAYQEAIKMAPEVQQFQDDYNAFLVRHGLKKPSSK